MTTDTPAASEWDERVQDACRAVLQKIVDTPVEEYPCLHMIVDNIFPADIYTEIQQNWPPDDAFIALNTTGRVGKDAYKARSIWMLTKNELQESLAAIPEQQRPFWAAMAAWLNSEEFIITMLDKCRDYLVDWYGDDLHQMRFFSRPQLVKDTGEYTLGPHTDAPGRVITMLFYMPPDETAREQGTSLYLPKDRDFRCKGGPHYPFDNFDRIMTADFLPNRLFMFIKNNASWHGVEPMICDGDKRRALSLKILSTKK